MVTFEPASCSMEQALFAIYGITFIPGLGERGLVRLRSAKSGPLTRTIEQPPVGRKSLSFILNLSMRHIVIYRRTNGASPVLQGGCLRHERLAKHIPLTRC